MIGARENPLTLTMLRRGATALLLAVFLAVATGPVAPIPGHAQAPHSCDDDFDDGQAQGWDLNWWSDGGVWIVGHGMLAGRGHAWARCAESDWPQGSYAFEFNLKRLTGGMHVNVHAGDAGRYAVGIRRPDPEYPARVSLYLFRDKGSTSDLMVEDVEYVRDDSRTGPLPVEIVTEGGRIQVSVDGYLLIDETDPDPLPPGTIGFETLRDSYAEIDDVRIFLQRAWTFDGHVYEGEVGDESRPLSGVTVELYCSGDEVEVGTVVDSTTTNSEGWYGLTTFEGCEVYNILETDPPAYTSAGATSIYGTVPSKNWIQYQYGVVEEVQTLTGNNFWDIREAEEVLSGHVYEGEVGDESRPLGGVRVEVQGADSGYPEPGEVIASMTTDELGWYGLEIPEGPEFYSIHTYALPGYEPAGATTVDGAVRTNEWIEYVIPMQGKTLADNKFWYRRRSAPVEPALECPEAELLQLLYQEDFNEGPGPQGWELEEEAEGRWQVEDDALTGTGLAWARYAKGDWDDQCVTFRLTCLTGTLDASVRVSEAGRYAIALGEEGTLLGVFLFKQLSDGARSVVDGSVIAYDPDVMWDEVEMRQGIDVMIETWGREIRVSVEGYEENPVIAFTDPDPLPPGSIAFETWSEARACVDDVVVMGPEPTPTATITPIPTQTQPPPALVTRTPAVPVDRKDGPDRDLGWLPIVAAIVVAIGGIGFGAWRIARKPDGEPTPPKPVIPPPPVRLANIWLTEGESGQGSVLSEHENLVAGTPYSLHLQIEPRGAEDRTDGESMVDSAEGEKTQLNVAFFSPETDFEFDRQTETLDLPGRGASNEIHRPIKPLQPGRHQIRACIYYGNVLLQSVLLDAPVVRQGERAAEGRISRTVDYIASADLTELGTFPQPDLNIFANQSGDGTHWIGVFSSEDTTDWGFRSGDLYTFGSADLAARASALRGLLQEIEGTERHLEEDMVKLAAAGWKLYHHLFPIQKGYSEREQSSSLRTALRSPGIVCIAHCQWGDATIPWAALYNLRLDRRRLKDIKLCAVFKSQLSGSDEIRRPDLLDNPLACNDSRHCPLADRDLRKLTVCPFGFWGFLHQVEQPLQQVKASWVEQVPDEAKRPGFNQTSCVESVQGEDVRMVAAVGPDLPDTEEHRHDFATLEQATRLSVVWEEDCEKVLEMLEQGGYQVYYFYCHGDLEDGELKLWLGPSDRPSYITADSLDPDENAWIGRPRSLVIVNGCETMAMTPDVINDFMRTLRAMGASGVVGTEIKVSTDLARPFGQLTLRHFVNGRSLGEAFLEVRRHLLRMWNPLGLAYTYYAPATLHLHEDGCEWCRLHPQVGMPRGGD